MSEPSDPTETTLFGRQLAGLRAPPGGAPGRYEGELFAEWNCPRVPLGGVTAAMSARAMELELDDESQRLRTLQVTFASPVAHGSVEAEASVVRHGRTLSQVRAEVRSVGQSAGASALGVFGAPRRGQEFRIVQPPSAAEPEDCWGWSELDVDGIDGFVRFPFWSTAEQRFVNAPFPWEKPLGGADEHVAWFRFNETPRLGDGTWAPLAVVALCDMMPGAVFAHLGDDANGLYGPSADLTVHLLGPVSGDWVLCRNRCRVAVDGYASLEVELWSGDVLAAYATQMMYFVYPDFFSDRVDNADERRRHLRAKNEAVAQQWESRRAAASEVESQAE